MQTPNSFQALLSNKQIKAPSGYREIQISDTYIYFDPLFEQIPVVTQNGELIGVIIGFPYDTKSDCFIKSKYNEIIVDDYIFPDNIDLIVKYIAGSYILLLKSLHELRLYLDHGGSIPIVYCSDYGVAASSASLILDDLDYASRFNSALYENLVSLEHAGGWISGTLTAHNGVRRLLPNHYLNLSTWVAKRYWPTPADLVNEENSAAAAPIICRSLAGFVGAAFKQFRTSATLTAGYDSRMILMASREAREIASFFTVAVSDGKIDVDVARDLTDRFGISHKTIEPTVSSSEEAEIWDRATGHCVNESNRSSYRTLDRLSDVDFILTGMFGEIGRCRLYRQDYYNINDKHIDESFVISRLTLPQFEPLNNNIKEWLNTLDGISNANVLDLAFWELKFGSWAMGQRPIQNSVKYALHPFTQRNILQLFLSLDPIEKQGGALFDECIKLQWPELLNTPINAYGDLRDYLGLLRKISNPYRVRRFLRDRFARADR